MHNVENKFNGKIAILKHNLLKGSIPSIKHDFVFQESNKSGMDYLEIKKNLQKKYILKKDIKKGNTIQKKDFKKARVGIAIVCRLDSSRLKNKALRKIGSLTSIEYCIKNVLKLDFIDDVILATSKNKDDEKLKNYTFNERVKFFRGSKNDLLKRILDVSEKNNLDVICRVTADNPFTSNEIFQKCIDSHFINGSDLTSCKEGPIGLTSRIFTVEALKRAIKLFPVRKYSEYLPFYFENNPEHFKINKLICPEEFKRNYRLTLDYKNDLIFFNKIDEKFNLDEQGKNYTLKLLKFLDENPKISEINSNEIVKYETDKKLIQKIKKETTINKNILGRYL